MTSVRPLPTSSAAEPAAPSREVILAAAHRASRLVAPVWPLQHFVAVNPFLGFAEQTFGATAIAMAGSAGARMTMPRAFYRDALRDGRLTDAHLERALGRLRADASLRDVLPPDLVSVHARLGENPPPIAPTIPTVTAVVGAALGLDLERFVVERISSWASGYFDRGQASWPSPWRDLPPFAAWRAETLVDRTPGASGMGGVRSAVAPMRAIAADALTACIARLGLDATQLAAYLQRATMSVAGWAAYGRYLAWESELRGDEDDTPLQLLAVRVAWDVALLESLAVRGAETAWRRALATWPSPAATSEPTTAIALDLVLQEGYELAWQEALVTRLSSSAHAAAPRVAARPSAQAAFCIDVRSEVIRRHLESVAPTIETIGFAGFFGFAIEYVPLGQEQGGAQCPVLLRPSVVVAEVIPGDRDAATRAVGERRQVTRWAGNLWRAFKQGAVSCFGFVGPVGLLYVRSLITDTLGLTRPVPHPSHDGIAPGARAALGPTLALHPVGDRTAGLPPEQRLAMAATVLKAMSLTSNFARLVVLAGHGSTTVNNPHATGLDCGACGGHTGEANARVAALVLNDADVRRGLRTQGLVVPDDTVFVAALHDTTTDEVTLLARDAVPATHVADVVALGAQLAEAARRARRERAPALGIAPGADADDAVLARTRDWAQVRPEWGLAGCASFIAAPRHRTAGLDLAGRAFLHSYAWQQDDGFGVLELIMTAPMVVASWISLQYYGSTVDPRAFGSGNKVLHNVVGALGVLEGNGGDLRTGLPLQSVHDGTRFMHEPLRLNVVIEAPREAMAAVIARHDGVRALLDNGWLTLWAMDGSGAVTHRYAGGLEWAPAMAA